MATRKPNGRRGKKAEPMPIIDDWPTMFIVTIGKWRVPFKLVDGKEFFSRDGADGHYVAAVVGDKEVRIGSRVEGEDLERAIGRAILNLSGDAVGMQARTNSHSGNSSNGKGASNA